MLLAVTGCGSTVFHTRVSKAKAGKCPAVVGHIFYWRKTLLHKSWPKSAHLGPSLYRVRAQ